MSDLIERQAAIDAIMKAAQEIENDIHLSLTMAQGARAMAVEVERLPSAQPERNPGKWILDDEYIDCSACRHEKWSRVPYESLVKRFNFCPNCGADMRGKQK